MSKCLFCWNFITFSRKYLPAPNSFTDPIQLAFYSRNFLASHPSILSLNQQDSHSPLLGWIKKIPIISSKYLWLLHCLKWIVSLGFRCLFRRYFLSFFYIYVETKNHGKICKVFDAKNLRDACTKYNVSEYIYHFLKMFFITWVEVLPNMEAHSYSNYIFYSKYLTNLVI